MDVNGQVFRRCCSEVRRRWEKYFEQVAQCGRTGSRLVWQTRGPSLGWCSKSCDL